MYDTDYFRQEIREWISWAEIHCSLKDDYFMKTDDDDVPWMDLVSAFAAADHFGASFREAAEEILVHDPSSFFARYAILNYLWAIVYAEWDGPREDVEVVKDDAQRLIRFIVPLAPVETLADWRKLAWEVGQAGLCSDHNRAIRLFDHAFAVDLLPRKDLQLLRARHLFLAIYLDSVREMLQEEFEGKLSVSGWGMSIIWYPSLESAYASQSKLNLGIVLHCGNARRLKTNLSAVESEYCRYVIADIESSQAAVEGKTGIFLFMLAACLYSNAKYVSAAETYNLLAKSSADKESSAPAAILRSIALSYELAGDLDKADSALKQLQDAYPKEKGVSLERIRISMNRSDHKRALELLREGSDLDETLSDNPLASLALIYGSISADQDKQNIIDIAVRDTLERDKAMNSLIDSMLKENWTGYRNLSAELKKELRWASFSHHRPPLLGPESKENQLSNACKSYAKVVEMQLKTQVFERFLRSSLPQGEKRLRVSGSTKETAVESFNNFIDSPDKGLRLTLGNLHFILKSLTNEYKDHAFHIWIKHECPMLLKEVRALGRIVHIRNDQMHVLCTATDEQVSEISKCSNKVLSAIS